MGNSNTKESRPDQPDASSSGRRASGDPISLARELARDSARGSRTRIGRSEAGFLGLGSGSSGRDRQDAPYERRETRQEREARRAERERQARLKERERSMQEEHVDGGYLVTLGTYIGPEDFSKAVVRQLQIERKMAPFWRGLNDWSDSWAEHQLVAAAHGLPIPAPDAPPDPELMPRPLPTESPSSQNLQNLTVPMGGRTLSTASDRSQSGGNSGVSSPNAAQAKSSPFIKSRGRALAAALSVGSRNGSSSDLTPKETNLPQDPFVNGQPLEVFLYKDASECPICFLTYPPYLNRTRCCDQPICSECFVQIKRADPHLPEHHPDGEARDPTQGLTAEDPPEMLISEASACPYCQQPEFGVTYDAPPFRRGLAYASSNTSGTAMSSQSSLNLSQSPGSPPQAGRRRTHSLSANAPNVITTDRVRPDWATKLAAARAHQARRAAAATALHTAAFLVGGSEQRSLLRPGRFSRRNTGNNGTAAAVEAPGGHAADAQEPSDPNAPVESGQGRDGRRSRVDELEEMMFMEAVRLSLASEEDRKRKEDKAIRKEAKRREKEERKAQRKNSKDPYGGGASGASGSSLSLSLGRRRGNSGASNLRVEATVQGASQASKSDGNIASDQQDKTDNPGDKDKGKGVDRGGQPEPEPEGSSASSSLPIPSSNPRGYSHLRHMSNASSIGSSVGDSPAGSYTGQGFLGPDASATNPRASGTSLAGRTDDGERDTTGTEPMFNFRSLAEIVGVDLENGTTQRAEGQESPSKDGGPLPQVQEDVKQEAEAEAEHIESAQPSPDPKTTWEEDSGASTSNATTQSDQDGAETIKGTVDGADVISSAPQLTITPDTTEEASGGENKQLGHSKVEERSAEITQ